MDISVLALKRMLACGGGINKFREMFGNDRVEVGKAILAYYKNDGWDDCRWFISRTLNRKNKIRFACYCAKQVLVVFETKFPDDKRPRKAINAAIRCSKNYTPENIDAAAVAAAAAAAAAYAAADAAAAYAAAAAAAAAAYAAAYADAAAAAAYAAAYADAAAAAYADAAAAAAYAAADAAAAAAAYADAAAAAYADAAAAAYAAADAAVRVKIIKYGIKLIREQSK